MHSAETGPVGVISRLLADGAPPRTNLSFGDTMGAHSPFFLLCTRLCQEIPCHPHPCTGPEPFPACISSGPLDSCATGRVGYVKTSSRSPNLSIAGMQRLALRQIHRPLSDCRCLQKKVSPFVWIISTVWTGPKPDGTFGQACHGSCPAPLCILVETYVNLFCLFVCNCEQLLDALTRTRQVDGTS